MAMPVPVSELIAVTLSGPELKNAREQAGMHRKKLAELLDISLKTVYNIESSAELRGPYRWAAYTIFPSLRPVVVSPEAE